MKSSEKAMTSAPSRAAVRAGASRALQLPEMSPTIGSSCATAMARRSAGRSFMAKVYRRNVWSGNGSAAVCRPSVEWARTEESCSELDSRPGADRVDLHGSTRYRLELDIFVFGPQKNVVRKRKIQAAADCEPYSQAEPVLLLVSEKAAQVVGAGGHGGTGRTFADGFCCPQTVAEVAIFARPSAKPANPYGKKLPKTQPALARSVP